MPLAAIATASNPLRYAFNEAAQAATQFAPASKHDGPALGARPLKRAILRELQNPLAEAILAGGYGQGQVVKVDVADDKFVFEKA